MEKEMYDVPPVKKIPKQQIAIIAVVAVLVIGIYFSGVWKTPFEVSTQKIQMLIIGQPSDGLLNVLNQDNSLADYTVKSASQLDLSPEQKLEEYDVIVLDQHVGETLFDHSVSRQLGEALQNYVRTGGKLIVVMDSGIYRSGTEGTISSDVANWEANFADLVPVKCETGVDEIGSCQKAIFTNGRIKRVDLSHKIMAGIEAAPLNPTMPPYALKNFDVKETGDIVAIIEEEGSSKTFPAIVEKKKLLGKVIYFNYDPAITPGIWQNTLEYLR
ncbi:MAG: hypothetical protein QGI60_05740 [archaeon]|jgi:hypothetical protein|nr:hypothetical protein [archaeon]